MISVSFRDSGIKAWAPSLARVCMLDLCGITQGRKFGRLKQSKYVYETDK